MSKSSLARVRVKALAVALTGLFVVLTVFSAGVKPAMAATTSSNLNFQARLLSSSGAVVPDGNYNIDFKIYTADSTTGSVGTCAGSCVWEETRKNSNSQGVQVINGYFSVNLGSVTGFGAINWDQQLWLTMNIGGTSVGASPTWDGEMQNAGHSIALTALPYAFTAGQLALTSGANRGTLGFGSVTNNPAITLPNASGTVCLNSSSACGFISGSGTAFIQNGNTLGATAVFGTLDGNGINIITNNHVVQSLSSTGAAVFENFSNSATAFQVQDSSASAYLNVNTADGYVINNGAAEPDNLVQNPSFESSGTTDATGWYTPSASQVLTNSSANAHTGNYELQVTGNSSTHAITTKYFAVHPGDTVYAEAYVKNSAGATGDGGIYLEFSDKDKGNATFTSADTGLPGTSYILKSITAAVPAGKTFVRIAASVKATATAGTFYFDDFYLARANQQQPLLVTNVSTTAFQVQNASAQTVLGVDTSTSKIFTTIPNSGSAVGFTLNTPSYTTAGAKLLSLQNNAAEKFSVDKDGNIVNTGGLAAAGDITTSGGNISAGAGKVFQINGTQITSAALSNNNDLAKLSGTGPQIFSGNNKFTGTVLAANTNAAGFQVQNATTNVFTVDTSGNKTILGTAGASGLTGSLQFNFSGSTGSISLVALDPSSTAYTLSLPAETGTLCTSAATSTGNCTNFASASGVTSSLATKLNKGLADTSSHAVTALEGDLYAFTNTSSGIASGVLKLDNGNNTDNALLVTGSTDYASGKAYILVNNTNVTPTGSLIDLQANASSVFKVDASGNITASGNISIGSGKLYEINGVQITTAALSDNNTIAKLAGNQTFSGNNTFSSASNSFTGDGSGLTNLNAGNVATGTLGDGRLSTNVALLNRTGQIFGGDNTFAPTGANIGTTFKQTSNASATSGSVLDVQTADGLSHFLQITNAAVNQGAVTLQSVGGSSDLTLGSGSGTINLTSGSTTIKKSGAGLTLDLSFGTASTLTVTNSSTGVASLSVQGDIAAGTSHVFKVGTTSGTTVSACSGGQYLASQAVLGGIVTGGSCANTITTIGTAGGSIINGASISANTLTLGYADTTNPGLVSATGSQSFTGTKIFTGSTSIQDTSATAFQVQTNSAGSTLMTANTSNMSVTVTGAQIYGSNTYSSGTTSTITQSLVDNNTTILASATAANLTFTVPSPTTTTAGRLLYVTNNGSNAFVISYGSGSFSLSVNSTVTLFWNGAAWTSAGADAGTLQTGYNNSTGSGTTPEIKLDSTRGGLDIQDADSTIGGNLLTVRASAVGALGTALFAVTSTGSVTIQNSSGVQLANLDATADAANLITNGSAETSPVNGTAKAGTGATPTLSQAGSGTVSPYIGNFSMSVATSSGDATNSGVKWSGSFTNSQAYNFTVYARASGSNFATFQLGNSNNNSTDTSCLTAQTVVTTGWTRFTCSFTYTGTTGTSYVYAKQTDSANRTYYLDAIKLETTSISTAYKESTISLEGVFNQPGTFKNQSDSTTAFQVQTSGGGNLLVVDSLNKQLKVYDGAGGANYALVYYDSTNSIANYTANTGTVAVGVGAGAITVTAGSGSAVNITANATSSWKTNTGTLTLQSGSGSSDFLILNSGGSNQIQVSGTSVFKLGSTTADPTCTTGAIYYNSTTNHFRGCENGTWANLDTITPSLQSAYTASTGSTTPEIKLDSATHGGLDIQDADSSAINGILLAVRGTNAANLGTSLFNVSDATSNFNVQVGSSSGHSTNPVILVLDNYSNSGADPTTTTNGAMYYNGTKNKFRCYENGGWVDCIDGPSESVTTLPYNNWATGVGTKAATGTLYIIPIYVPGQMTVNEMRINVTVALGATGDIGLYDINGNLVINGGSGSLSTATGLKTITPTQSNKVIEAGQYYAAVTWNSTTGQVGGITGLTTGQLKHVGTLTGGGSVLPSSITISSITNGTVMPGMTFNN
jgi:mucin-19